MFGLIVLPVLTALTYLFVRGDSIAERSIADAKATQADADACIKSVAGPPSPAAQIAQAKELLDAGTIDQTEFAALTAKALP